MQCLCKGIIINNKCDRCAHLPNSEWKYGRCQCLNGYTLYNGICALNSVGNDKPSSCNVGTFFDHKQRKCLACPDGCLTCKDCYTCELCKPEFNFDAIS